MCRVRIFAVSLMVLSMVFVAQDGVAQQASQFGFKVDLGLDLVPPGWFIQQSAPQIYADSTIWVSGLLWTTNKALGLGLHNSIGTFEDVSGPSDQWYVDTFIKLASISFLEFYANGGIGIREEKPVDAYIAFVTYPIRTSFIQSYLGVYGQWTLPGIRPSGFASGLWIGIYVPLM